MNVIINDQLIELIDNITITELFVILKKETYGVALAINKVIIPKSKWDFYQINNQDKILLFQVIAGG